MNDKNNELENMWKELVIAHFKVLSWNLPGGKTSMKIVAALAKIPVRCFLNTSKKNYHLSQLLSD